MNLQISTNAFDVDVKDLYTKMNISKQYFYSILADKEKISEKRAVEILDILKDLDAKAFANEEALIKQRREERRKMIEHIEKLLEESRK